MKRFLTCYSDSLPPPAATSDSSGLPAGSDSAPLCATSDPAGLPAASDPTGLPDLDRDPDLAD